MPLDNLFADALQNGSTLYTTNYIHVIEMRNDALKNPFHKQIILLMGLLFSVFFFLFVVVVIFLLARYRCFVPKMNLDLSLVLLLLRSSRHRLLVETAQFQCLWLSCMSDWRLHLVSNNTSFAHRRVLFRSLRRIGLDGASEWIFQGIFLCAIIRTLFRHV